MRKVNIIRRVEIPSQSRNKTAIWRGCTYRRHDSIKVFILEKEFAALCRLGLHVSVTSFNNLARNWQMLCGQQSHPGVVSQSAYFGLQIL